MTDKTDKKAHEMVEWAENQQVPRISDVLPFFDLKDLPPKRRKVLVVSALPQCLDWTIEKKSELAGVSPRYWSICMGKPDFLELSAQMARKLLGSHVFDTTHAFLESAKKGNIVAQLAHLRQLDVLDKDNGNGPGAPVTVNIAIIQQERQERIGESLKRFGYEVAATEVPIEPEGDK